MRVASTLTELWTLILTSQIWPLWASQWEGKMSETKVLMAPAAVELTAEAATADKEGGNSRT